MKYGIPDLRTFYDSDLRWMRHYGFLPFDALRYMPVWLGGQLMKFTRDWLFDHLQTDRTLDEILDALPMLGLEVNRC